MPDYAISAVGQGPANERLMESRPGNEVLNFEEIGSRHSSSWDLTSDSCNQIRILQRPSPVDTQLKNEKTPWDSMSTRVLDRLEDIQNRWDKTMKPTFSQDDFGKGNNTLGTGSKAMRAEVQNILKAFYRLTDTQVRMAIATSIATTVKKSITTLYRQQG